MSIDSSQPPQTKKLSRRRLTLRTLSIFNFAALSLLWLLVTFVAERHPTTTLLTYTPQQPLGIPAVCLLLWSVVAKKKRLIAFNAAVCGLFLFQFLGFNVPLRSLVRSGGPADGPHLRVMTYNILYGWRGIGKIAADIRREQPDVVCLQETRSFRDYPDPIPQLRKLLPGWHVARGAEVTTFSRFPIVSNRNHPMPRRTGRTLLETVINVRGRKVVVFNTHFSTTAVNSLRHPPNIPLLRLGGSPQMRALQAQILIQATQQTTLPVVVMGDFNTPPRGRVYATLTRHFSDAFRAAGWGFGSTFHNALPLLRIDHIFTGRSIRVRSCHVARTSASDHRPVVADLAW